MSSHSDPPRIALPKAWPKRIHAAVLQVISLAHFALAYSRSWAVDSPIARVRLKAVNDQLKQQGGLLNEEIRIKDARMARVGPAKRPHYSPIDRMAILELRAARGWSTQQTADRGASLRSASAAAPCFEPLEARILLSSGSFFSIVEAAYDGVGDVAVSITAFSTTSNRDIGPAQDASGDVPLDAGAAVIEQYSGTIQGSPGVGTGSLDEIAVYLQGWDADGSAIIQSGVETWILIHGRVSSSASLHDLAADLATATGDQVVLLDWEPGASDNSTTLGLEGAGWIPLVAEWVSSALDGVFGIGNGLLRLAGHSWGSYVAYEIAARQSGEAKTLVALDPARDAAAQYPAGGVDFAAETSYSWAFYGDGLYGDAQRSGTADAAFVFDYSPALGLFDAGEQHTAPKRLFERLIEDGGQHRIGDLFNIDRIENGYAANETPWALNQYASVFEGQFTLGDGNGDDEYAEVWSDVLRFRYEDVTGNEVIVFGTDYGDPPPVLKVQPNTGIPDPQDLPAGEQPTSWPKQRSSLRAIVVTFDGLVEPMTAADLVLTNLGVDAPNEADSDVPLSDGQIEVDGDTLTIHFAAGELADGVYELRVLDANGGDLHVMRGDRDNGLYQLTGDWNGDGGVSLLDFPSFQYWFGQDASAAPAYMNLNGDGVISLTDFPAFQSQFGKQITIDPLTAQPVGEGAVVERGKALVADEPHEALPVLMMSVDVPEAALSAAGGSDGSDATPDRSLLAAAMSAKGLNLRPTPTLGRFDTAALPWSSQEGRTDGRLKLLDDGQDLAQHHDSRSEGAHPK